MEVAGKGSLRDRTKLLWSALVAGCVLALTSHLHGAEAATVPTYEELAAQAEFRQAEISPDGTHLAVDVVHEGRRALAVLATEDLKVVSVSGFYDAEVGGFEWINNERLVMTILRKRAGREAPGSYGEIYAVNADGSAPKYLYGINADEPALAYGDLLGKIDDRNVLIQSFPFAWPPGKDGIPQALKLNIYSGRISREARSSLRGAQFVPDEDMTPRFVQGVDDNNEQIFSYQPRGSRDWQDVEMPFGEGVRIRGFEPGTDALLVIGANGNEKGIWGLHRFDLKSKEVEELYAAADTDVEWAYFDDDDQLYGVQINRHYPEFVPLIEDHPLTVVKGALQNNFPAHTVSLVSKTEDNQKFIVRLSAPNDPPSFYLFDVSTGSLRFLMHMFPNVEGKLLASTDGISFKARDGQVINGYITTPPVGEAPFPLIVMPHGGPHARDYWGYDRYVQSFATRGYAVLQVNFRGSTGFGDAFMQAGYGEWGRMTQHDIIDGTRWAIADGVADPARVGIYGASFGGYSAFQAPLVAPGLYRAAIGYVGVYDLDLLYNSGDITTRRWGEAYLDKTLPSDPEDRSEQSPARRASEFDIPLFIVHGKDDYRAAFEHAEVMRDALQEAGKPFEWLVKDKEEHGFYTPENTVELFGRMAQFFDEHLGASAPESRSLE
jgi:acetyl esterase/lipase